MDYINKLQNELVAEKEHSAFLEQLLKTLYGNDWGKLTLSEAKKWRERFAMLQQDSNPRQCVLFFDEFDDITPYRVMWFSS